MTPAPGIKIADAFALFGYDLNQRIDPAILKKRYRALLFSVHPDHGGKPEDFRFLQDAYKLLKHYEKKPNENTIHWTRIDPDKGSGYNLREKCEENLADGWDLFGGICGVFLLCYLYRRHQTKRHDMLYVNNYKMSKEEFEASRQQNKNTNKYNPHPWRTEFSALFEPLHHPR